MRDRRCINVLSQLSVLLLVAWSTSCAAQDARTPPVPSGLYELQASMGGQAFPVRLELLSLEDGPWGRLTIVAGQERAVAVRGTGVTEGAWDFAVGGPVRRLRLRFADTVAGEIVLGGAPPIPVRGRRAGDLDAPAELRAHAALEPLGLAARAGEEGASFPTGTPEGELVFARHGPDLSRQTLMIAPPADGGWGDPRVLDVGGEHSDRSPAVLPDGSGLVFASDRPAPGGEAAEESEVYRLWFAPRREPGDWGAPTPVRFEGGWEHDARQPSVTAEGTLYFSSDAPGGHGEGDIHVANPVAPGRWSSPRNLGEPVNGPGDEHGAFVAPDGSYMILASAGERPGSSGGDDLYLSRRDGSGWSPPAALDLPVNTFANEYGVWVSPPDGHLYFSSDRYGHADIFRVDAGFLTEPGVLPAERR